jgi:hypothetical protein
MIRAVFYLLAAGVVWMAEGFLFSYFLDFAVWQTVLMTVVYVVLFGVAVMALRRQLSTTGNDSTLTEWRYLSMAPMVVVIIGSFASLPVLLLIAAAGKL